VKFKLVYPAFGGGDINLEHERLHIIIANCFVSAANAKIKDLPAVSVSSCDGNAKRLASNKAKKAIRDIFEDMKK
jgi:hypothetical protein